MTAAETKREAHKSQVSRLLSANHPPRPACSRCQRAFCARIGIVRHLCTQRDINLTTSASSPTLAPAANSAPTADHNVAAPPPPSTDNPTTASTAAASVTTSTTSRTPPPPTDGTTSNVPSPVAITTNTPIASDVDSVHTRPRCDRAFTSA
nr:unnamed protein product [Spirometra erinaceieuropaei]